MKLNARQIEEACELDNDVEQDLESDRLDREHLEFHGDDWRSEIEPDDTRFDEIDQWEDIDRANTNFMYDYMDEPFYNDDDRSW